jgi:hypothetical protein
LAADTLERKRLLGHYSVLWQDGRSVSIREDVPAHLAAPPSETFALKLRDESNNSTQEIKMIDSETLEQLKNASIEERISIIEVLLRSLKNDMPKDVSLQPESVAHPQRPAFGFMKDTGEILGDIIAPIFPKNA